MCIFLLECVLAKCILFCMWVFKNLHKWYWAENPIPFPAFVTQHSPFKNYLCCSVLIYSRSRHRRGLQIWRFAPDLPPNFPRPDSAMVAASHHCPHTAVTCFVHVSDAAPRERLSAICPAAELWSWRGFIWQQRGTAVQSYICLPSRQWSRKGLVSLCSHQHAAGF